MSYQRQEPSRAAPTRRRRPTRSDRTAALWRAAAALWAVQGCSSAATNSTPEGAVAAYAASIQRGDAVTARSLLSEPQAAQLEAKALSAQWARYPEESRAIAERLQSPAVSTAERALVVLRNGQEVQLTRDPRAGTWRIVRPSALLYDQSTPRAALRSFVWALRHQRWQVLLELMPEGARGAMTAAELGEHLGQQRQEYQRMLALLETSLDRPIEQVGERATMPYGDRFAVRFVREGELWKIEDPE